MYMLGPDGEPFETENPEWHKDSRKITKREYVKASREYSRAWLLRYLKPGSRVYTKVESVSRSGMSRVISVYIADERDSIMNVSAWVCKACDLPRAKTGLAVKMDGCGGDMGFAIVYQLGHALWPDGTPEPHGTRNGEPDSDGGYALKHCWL